MITITESRRQYTFRARESAESFRAALKACRSSCRTKGTITLRKSLPEFRHHGNPGWSVYVTPWAMPDASEIAQLATRHGGRIWGKAKLFPVVQDA